MDQLGRIPPIPGQSTSGTGSSNQNAPPALPPRPATAVGGLAGGYGGFGSGYMGNTGYGTYGAGGYGNPYSSTISPYGGGYINTGMYGGGGMYGGAGNFGYGSGMQPYGNSNFFRIAEEGGRGAMQSVETVVHMFTSISAMLDSSLQAVYSSFRAVIGVAEQFTLLKQQLFGILSTISALKFLQWLFRRILVALRMRPANYAAEIYANDAWNEALSASSVLPGAKSSSSPKWGSLGFFAIALGGPWLVYKMISRIVNNVEEQRKWTTGEATYYEARGLYDFNAVQQNELPIRTGETFRVAPKELQPQIRGWLLGASLDGQKVGLVPINYTKIVASRPAGYQMVPQPGLIDANNDALFQNSFPPL